MLEATTSLLKSSMPAVSTEAGIGFFKESASCGGRLSDSEKNDVYRVATIDLKEPSAIR